MKKKVDHTLGRGRRSKTQGLLGMKPTAYDDRAFNEVHHCRPPRKKMTTK